MIAKISDIADVQGGMVLSRKEAKSPEDTVCEYQRLTLRSFDETGNIDKVELETFHACESLENVLFTQTGDVVIRLVSPMYPVYIEAGYDGILVPSQFAVLRVKDNMEIAPEYLRLCLAQRIIQDRILNLESGTAQKTVKIKTVLDLEIPLQPLHIQQEAVQIDRLGRKRELMYRELIENERILCRYSTDKYAAKTIIESSVKGNKHNFLLYISIIVLVILMACLFSTLDSAVTLVHSDGIADIGQGARILLAFSGLAAGFIFDISNRKYTGIIMYCIMILSTLCIVLLEFSKPFVAVLIVFYLSAGFFAVFFTSEFMELSQYVRIPELWAGMGRAVNNITAAVIASFVLQLLSSDNNLLKIVLILVLFVLVSIMSVIYTFEKYYFIQQFTQHTDKVTNEQDQLHKLTTQYSFTEREGEVFSYLVTTEDNIQTISEHMHVSRRTLERYISAIYEKTGVKSRVGLINLFNKCD